MCRIDMIHTENTGAEECGAMWWTVGDRRESMWTSRRSSLTSGRASSILFSV